jgi:hypothetical protein
MQWNGKYDELTWLEFVLARINVFIDAMSDIELIDMLGQALDEYRTAEFVVENYYSDAECDGQLSLF